MTDKYVYQFVPRLTITAYEVALLLKEFMPDVKPEAYDELPQTLRQHFERAPAPKPSNVVTQNDSS